MVHDLLTEMAEDMAAADRSAGNRLTRLTAELDRTNERWLDERVAWEAERNLADLLHEALEELREEHDACWCGDGITEAKFTCILCAADDSWHAARAEQE
jgi:hypothetical protein